MTEQSGPISDERIDEIRKYPYIRKHSKAWHKAIKTNNYWRDAVVDLLKALDERDAEIERLEEIAKCRD